MTIDFYDKIARKLGGYGYGLNPEYSKEFPGDDPEEVFKGKIIELASKDKTVFDIGCADGKFTISVSPYFKKVFGIDTSKVNLDIAKSHRGDLGSENVEYSLQNAAHTNFKESFFDLAYCRRGPAYYDEYHRVLKLGGHYVEIGIGEQDTKKIQEKFGRGQNFGGWDNSRLGKNIKTLKCLNFDLLFAKDYHYVEYYPSYEALDLFLSGVPIFEDYDTEKDRAKLEEYIAENTTPKGIMLPRHRIVLVAQKIG